LGLSAFWTLGEDGWNTGMDTNLRTLSVLVQGKAISKTTSLPGSPTNGDIYIVPTADANGDEIAIRDDGAWVYIVPIEGDMVYVTDASNLYQFDGAAWQVFSGGAAGLPGLVGNAGKVLAVNALEDAAEWITPTGGGTWAWHLEWSPIDNEPPAANYATLDARNSRPVLDFDGTTQEAAIFTGILPSDYAAGGVTVTLWCALSTAITGTVGWDIAFERTQASTDDINSDSFATAATVTAVTVPGTSGQVLKMSVNIADGAGIDSLAAGDLFRLRVRRDVATDTATGDAELLRVALVEQ
jgi:hypothetical protein